MYLRQPVPHPSMEWKELTLVHKELNGIDPINHQVYWAFQHEEYEPANDSTRFVQEVVIGVSKTANVLQKQMKWQNFDSFELILINRFHFAF